MHDVLPIYCETALNLIGTFPAEPVNAITSFFPVVMGLLALVFLIRHRHRNRVAYTLAVLTILTGLGSVAWHSLRTETTLALDALPGVIYFAVAVFFWIAYLGSRIVAILLVVAFAALVFAVPLSVKLNYQFLIVAILVLIAVGMLVATWRLKPESAGIALLMVGSAVVAVTMRTLDLRSCEVIPFGTHFLWHIFLGIAAYAGVRLMVNLRPTRRPDAPANGKVVSPASHQGRQST